MYSNSLSLLQFDGPTFFSNILREVSKLAVHLHNSDPYTYSVLLILTDG